MACGINDEAQTTPAEKERETESPSVSIDAPLTQARELPVMHQVRNERSFDRETRGYERSIDEDGALVEFHAAHSARRCAEREDLS